MKKRILAFLLVFCMTVSLLPSTVFATNTESEKTKVNLVLVDGQSNAAGNCGEMLDATVEMPDENTAFLWNGNGLDDLGLIDYSSRTASVGFHPAMAKALYEATGVPTVIVHEGHSGQSIHKWTSSNTATSVAAVTACKTWLASNGYEIENSAYVWLQGESDACPDYVADYCNYATLSEYYTAYAAMHDAYVSALGNDAVGGIITVQTRLQLLSNVSKASEYIGVRAAQQALANQIEGLVIVSDITDGWRMSTDSEKFSVSGGPIHYSQAGYNAIGLDAGTNLAKVWASNAAVIGFEVVGYNGTTVYADGTTIKVSDNLIYEGTENTREHGAAQIVVKPLPVYADCAGVTMTAEGDVITNNGYIADASSIKGDLELTVTVAGSVQTFAADSGLTQTFTLSGGDTLTSTTPETSADFDYQWDFTDTALVNGKVLTAVKGGNDLTYQGTNDIVLTSGGMNNCHTTNGRMYFLMDEAITLPADSPWTITWQGSLGSSSTVVANTSGNTASTAGEIIYCPGGTGINLQNGGSVKAGTGQYWIDSSVSNSTDTVWYVIYDGNNGFTLACTGGHKLEKTYVVPTTGITFDAVLGYFMPGTSNKIFNYYGTIKSLRIYSEAYELPTEDTAITGTQTVSLTAPMAGMVPETSVSGTGYTGTVVWTPSADKFAGNTVYTAAVTLTAADGYVFDTTAIAAVTGATVSEIVVANDGSTLTFKAAFPATEEVTFNAPSTDDFYWDFTTATIDGNEVSSVTGEGWAENPLTFNGNSFSRTAADGISGSSNRFEYFAMEYPASLPKDDVWTIEWGGKVSSGSIMFSDNNLESGDLPANSQHQHLWYDGNGIMHLRDKTGSDAGSLTLNTSAYSGKDAVWYVINDHGTLTLAACYNGEWKVATKPNGITQDYEIDSLFGIYANTSGMGFDLQGSVKYMKIYHEAVELPVAKIGDQTFTSLADAFAAVETGAYPATPTSATTITLLTDVESGFDVGVETGSTSTFKTQNTILDLNGYTLTLGHPPVGSSSLLKTNGLRVLAFSKLEIKNGNVAVDNDTVRIAMANYGTLTLTDVDVTADTGVIYTINNRGDLTLAGATSVVNGTEAAITNQPYNYPDAQNINAKLNVASADVVVGDVQVELSDVEQAQTGAINAGVPEINISAGTFGKIYDDGETAKTPVGNITGGTFSEAVPSDMVADGYVPTGMNSEGKYSVEVGTYKVEMNGQKYATISLALEAAEKELYSKEHVTTLAPTTIKLIANVNDGFDIGVETFTLSTFKTQNIVIDLNGYTLTLDKAVGSPGTVSNGIRVLAHSKLEIKNGIISCEGEDVRRVINNYGELTLTDVVVNSSEYVDTTIGNLGELTLAGKTEVKNGNEYAIFNKPYQYPYATDVNAVLNISDATVTVGKVLVRLSEVKQPQNGSINDGVPEINISAGQIESIADDGETAKTPVGNITGGTFSAAVPENLCADGYIPADNGDGTYGVKIGEYVVEMTVGGVTTKYEFINDAVANAPVDSYANGKAGSEAEKAIIKLLKDTKGGFDVGVETGSLSTWKIQNIEIDLNGHTLTLGQPPVGSGSEAEKDNGIRVLAYSKLSMTNGIIECPDEVLDNAINNYGELTLDDVDVKSGNAVVETIKNSGDLALTGETSVANGGATGGVAILNITYMYSDDSQVGVTLTIEEDTVTTGKIVVDLAEYTHSQTGDVNAANPEIIISAGQIESIESTGDDKELEGGVSGGTFDVVVPEDLCADGFVPVTEADANGKYTVEEADYVVEMTVGGVTTKYESINDAVANAPTASYAEGKAGGEAEKAVIKLLKDTKGGFDVGVETGSLSTWKIQNIEIDLNGHTLTLGQPLVGSTGTKTSGIRVLAYSKLSIYNGTIAGDTALRGLQNYGAAVVEDVEFTDMYAAYDAIGNFGSLELKGETIVPNGSNSAILNSSYQYSDDSQVGVTLTIEEDTVTTGKIVVDLAEYTHSQTGDVNAANPEIIISAGQIESIESTGDDKELEGGVSGGTFSEVVPEDLCADGFVPVTEPDENGKYTVEVAPETRAVTRIENSAEYSFSSDGKTLSVKNDQACVVIVKNGENYTKLTATENADDGYDYDVSGIAAAAEIIIVIKGDFNLDGEITMADASSIMNAWVNNTAVDEVAKLAVDLNASGEIDMNDAASIMNAWVNDTSFSW